MSTELLTTETWPDYLQDGGNLLMYGYYDAITAILPELKKRLDRNKSYEELRSDLLSLYKDQEQFIDHLKKNWKQKNWKPQ